MPSPLSRNLLFVDWKQGASTHTVFAIESLDKVNWSLRVESMLPSHALSFHTHTLSTSFYKYLESANDFHPERAKHDSLEEVGPEDRQDLNRCQHMAM